MLATLLPVLMLLAAGPEGAEAPEVSVPFACGRSYPVSQAHDVGSHTRNDTWAWDFRMPEGVPITAALDGTVRLARGDSRRGGCGIEFAKDANYVVVTHAGGLETQYLHFAKVVVKPGDAVKAGDLLGYSGRTGWACGSHLHFKLARTEHAGWNNPSVPAKVERHGDPTLGAEVAAAACSTDRPYVASLDATELLELSREPAPNAMALVRRVEQAAGSSATAEMTVPAAAGATQVLGNR